MSLTTLTFSTIIIGKNQHLCRLFTFRNDLLTLMKFKAKVTRSKGHFKDNVFGALDINTIAIQNTN